MKLIKLVNRSGYIPGFYIPGFNFSSFNREPDFIYVALKISNVSDIVLHQMVPVDDIRSIVEQEHGGKADK